ncbi:MAG: hypothetical protein HKL95_09020, partial [Phycisphaerae bacterium]|nr:hypothetical protein [Phycisphaerae bacterium]
CGRSSWFVDIDSFMGSAGCPVHERRFRCAVGYLTSGMLDFSGPIETLDKLALSDYRRLCQRCDQGGTVRVPDREAFFGVPLPRILVRLHSADSITRRKHGVQATVGLFNWQEAACISGVSLAGLGLKTRAAGVRDFWTGRTIRAADGRLNVELPPRHHVMVDVMA